MVNEITLKNGQTIELNQAFNCDCLEFMRRCKDNTFSLCLTDPPYGIGADNFSNSQNLNRNDGSIHKESTTVKVKKNRLNSGSGKLKNRVLNKSDCSWDIAPSKEMFDELFRVSKNQIIWGYNYFNLPQTRGIAVWDKCQPWENFSQVELAYTSFDKPASIYRLSNTGGSNSEAKFHPTQKPLKLFKWCLQKYAHENSIVFDPFLGSFTTAVACHHYGLRWIGCEKDEDYFKAGYERYNNECKQTFIDFGG